MKSDVQGCSTCPIGGEQYELFPAHIGSKKVTKVQYDYRDTDGKLFSCVANTLVDARAQKDHWIAKKNSDKRQERLDEFLSSVNARYIHTAKSTIYNGCTTYDYYTANGRNFVVMRMVQLNILTLIDIMIQAFVGNDMDKMFEAVKNYITTDENKITA